MKLTTEQKQELVARYYNGNTVTEAGHVVSICSATKRIKAAISFAEQNSVSKFVKYMMKAIKFMVQKFKRRIQEYINFHNNERPF